MAAYGDVSIVHICSMAHRPCRGRASRGRRTRGLVHKWRCALILHGVDMSQNHGWVSAVHTDREIEETAQAVARAVADLQAEGAV